MWLWNESIDVLRESMLAYAQVCNGNLGDGILIVTFLARLALLPLGLRLAKIAQAHQRAMQKIQPELDALKRKFEKTRAGSPKRPGALIQIPVFLALYAAVR